MNQQRETVQKCSKAVANTEPDVRGLAIGIDASTSKNGGFTETGVDADDVRTASHRWTTRTQGRGGEGCALIVLDLTKSREQAGALRERIVGAEHHTRVLALGEIAESGLRQLSHQ